MTGEKSKTAPIISEGSYSVHHIVGTAGGHIAA